MALPLTVDLPPPTDGPEGALCEVAAWREAGGVEPVPTLAGLGWGLSRNFKLLAVGAQRHPALGPLAT